jgi:ribosomal protein S27E
MKCYSCRQNTAVGGKGRDGNHCQDCNKKGYVSVACPDCTNRDLVLFGIPKEKLLIVGCPLCGHRSQFLVKNVGGDE